MDLFINHNTRKFVRIKRFSLFLLPFLNHFHKLLCPLQNLKDNLLDFLGMTYVDLNSLHEHKQSNS